jgi:hypothetical protein
MLSTEEYVLLYAGKSRTSCPTIPKLWRHSFDHRDFKLELWPKIISAQFCKSRTVCPTFCHVAGRNSTFVPLFRVVWNSSTIVGQQSYPMYVVKKIRKYNRHDVNRNNTAILRALSDSHKIFSHPPTEKNFYQLSLMLQWTLYRMMHRPLCELEHETGLLCDNISNITCVNFHAVTLKNRRDSRLR